MVKGVVSLESWVVCQWSMVSGWCWASGSGSLFSRLKTPDSRLQTHDPRPSTINRRTQNGFPGGPALNWYSPRSGVHSKS